MLHVIVDWNCFQKGGIYRYFAEVLPRISKLPEISLDILGNASRVVSPPKGDGVQHVKRITPSASWFPDGPLKRSLSQARQRIDKLYWQYRTGKKKNAVYHPTHYQPSPLPKLPLVLTIHDLIPELYPEYTQGDVFDALRVDKKRAISESTRIVTNSYQTKNDLCQFYGTDPNIVDVTPLGVNFDFFSERVTPLKWNEIRSKLFLSETPYFLYVGGRLHYKNFSRCLQAYAMSSVRDSVRVVVAGSNWDQEEETLLKHLEIRDRVDLVPNPDEETLRALYQNAVAFIYPSLYEGFGLPILEAMSSQTPVLSSTGGALPEVGGNVALYFDPCDPSTLASQMEAVMDPDVANKCRSMGKTRAQNFSWEDTARLTVESYQKVFA